MVCISDHAVALANKLAAWNERRLVRDLYDIWFLLQMGITPDRETMAARLRKPDYSRLVKTADRFPGKTVEEFFEFVRNRAARLRDVQVQEELSDYLPSAEREGLAMQIRAALVKLR